MKLTTATASLLALLVALPVAASAQTPGRGQTPPKERGQTPPKERGEKPKPTDEKPKPEGQKPAEREGREAPGRVHDDGAATGQNLRARYAAAVDDLQKRALARGATREDYQRVLDQLTAGVQADEAATPAIAAQRQRIAARIQGIEERARAGAVEATEFDAVRDGLVDLDLEIALGRLTAAAKAGKYSRAEYKAFEQAWEARAEAAKAGNPELDAIAARTKAALEAIDKRAQSGAVPEADIAPLQDAVAEARANVALRRLEARAMDKKAVPADYEDVMAAVRASSGEEIAKKFKARLDELKTAVEGGRITREQFTELRTMLVKRARAAATDK